MDAVGPEILARLLDEQGAALTLYARQWCDAPEDVVQEAFVHLAYERPVPSNIVGWLYRVVRNGAISAARIRPARTARVGRRTAGRKLVRPQPVGWNRCGRCECRTPVPAARPARNDRGPALGWTVL